MIIVDERYCKGCGICIHLCPKHALVMSAEVNARGYHLPCVVERAECGHCGQCELFCPDFAIFTVGEQDEAKR